MSSAQETLTRPVVTIPLVESLQDVSIVIGSLQEAGAGKEQDCNSTHSDPSS